MKNKGFTLIELVISISLITVLLIIVFVFFFQVMNFLEADILIYPVKSVNMWKLDQLFESMFTYVYDEKGKHKIYFIGNKQECSFVSYFDPFNKVSLPVVVEVALEKDCLVVKDYPIYSKSVDYLHLKKFNASSNITKLFCGIKNISFSYAISKGSSRKFDFSETLYNQIPEFVKLNLVWNSGKTSHFLFEVPAFDRQKEILSKVLSSNISI